MAEFTELLNNAEKIDKFIYSCSTNDCNMLARKNCLYKVMPIYNEKLQIFLLNTSLFKNINVIQLHPSAENGFPHTRPNNIICIPNTSKFPSLKTTLYHEYIHIHQRNNVALWKEFLGKEQWSKIEDSEIPERWFARCRINPDTCYSRFWAYENRYIPLPLFVRPHDPYFEEVEIVYYDLRTGILQHEVPETILRRYGENRQSEHPFEIYAVEMEDKISSEKDILDYLNV